MKINFGLFRSLQTNCDDGTNFRFGISMINDARKLIDEKKVVKLISSFSSDMVAQLVRLSNNSIPEVMGAAVQLLGTMAASVTYRQTVATATKVNISRYFI